MPCPVVPVLPGIAEIDEVEWAKDQPEYNTLPAITYRENPQVPVTSRWKFTDLERKAIAEGADLYLTLLTFGVALQPVILQVFSNEEAAWNIPRQGLAPLLEGPAHGPDGPGASNTSD
jgi:hypothetical protein